MKKDKRKIQKVFLKTIFPIMLFFLSVSLFPRAWDYNGFYASTSFLRFERAGQPHGKISFRKVNEELLAASLFYYTNKVRLANGLKPFKYSRFLQLAAYGQAQEMAVRGIRAESTQKIIRRIKVFSHAGYNTVKSNAATFSGLMAQPGTQVEAPVYPNEPYRNIDTGAAIQPYTYWGFAKSVIDMLLNHPVTRENILNPQLKVLGIGAHIFFYGTSRIPLFKITQIFTDGITDELDTGDIALLPQPKMPPIME